MAKKDIYKFTIQFSGGDPQHQQVAEILNQQGRRKAQFLVNTVLHYIHCSETPDIPQPSPVNTDAIEAIVRRFMEVYSEKPTPKDVGQAPEKKTVKSEEIAFDDAAELLGELGMGILMKAIPQINAFVINMELKVIIGLILLFLFLTPLSEFLLGAEADMLSGLRRGLAVMAGSG